MATWKEPKNDYTAENQVKPEIFNTLAENEKVFAGKEDNDRASAGRNGNQHTKHKQRDFGG